MGERDHRALFEGFAPREQGHGGRKHAAEGLWIFWFFILACVGSGEICREGDLWAIFQNSWQKIQATLENFGARDASKPWPSQ